MEKSQTNADIDNVSIESIDIDTLKKKNIDFDNDIVSLDRENNDNVRKSEVENES